MMDEMTRPAGDHLLTMDELTSPGELKRIEVPERPGADGRPGIVYIRQPSAGLVLEIIAQKPEERQRAILDLLPDAVVDAAGSPIFTGPDAKERVRRMPADVFGRLAEAIIGDLKTKDDAEGNPSGEAAPANDGGSPTASPTPSSDPT